MVLVVFVEAAKEELFVSAAEAELLMVLVTEEEAAFLPVELLALGQEEVWPQESVLGGAFRV